MAALYINGVFEGEHYIVRGEAVIGIRQLDKEEFGLSAVMYEVLLNYGQTIRIDEDSARRVEDFLTGYDRSSDEGGS